MRELFSIQDIILLAMIVFVMSSMVIILVLWVKKDIRKNRYVDELNKVVLSQYRENLEVKISDLYNKLAFDEDRWKELNHLIESAQQNIEESKNKGIETKISKFLLSADVTEEDFNSKKDFILVLTPFSRQYSDTFEVVSSVCSNVGAMCLRGDEQFIKGNVLNHILKLIVKSRLIIANIDGRNANVFYELGIAHVLDKEVIVIAKNTTNLPFDVKSNKIIIYRSFNDLKTKLYAELAKINFDTRV